MRAVFLSSNLLISLSFWDKVQFNKIILHAKKSSEQNWQLYFQQTNIVMSFNHVEVQIKN